MIPGHEGGSTYPLGSVVGERERERERELMRGALGLKAPGRPDLASLPLPLLSPMLPMHFGPVLCTVKNLLIKLLR
jgi:hypothetical protein